MFCKKKRKISHRLRESVNILRKTTAPDDYGSTTETWSILAAGKKARMRPLRNSEAVHANQIMMLDDYEMTCRMCDVTAADRIDWKGRVFNIVSVKNFDERGRKLTLKLSEVKK